LKQIHLVIIGVSIVAFSVFVYVFYFAGLCSLGFCETEIQITSYDSPESVYVGDKFSADFTIKNTGSIKAENCILHWTPQQLVMGYDFSESFSLLPSQEISITLETHAGAGTVSGSGGKGPVSTAWVVCDNTESPKIQKQIGREYPP